MMLAVVKYRERYSHQREIKTVYYIHMCFKSKQIKCEGIKDHVS